MIKNIEVDILAAVEIEQANGVHLAERELVALAATGDPEAFSAIYRKHKRRLYWTAIRITDNESDAEDVLQEAFFKAYRNLAAFRFDSTCSQSTNGSARRQRLWSGLTRPSTDMPGSNGLVSASI